MGLVIKAQNHLRDIGRPQVAMHRDFYILQLFSPSKTIRAANENQTVKIICYSLLNPSVKLEMSRLKHS